MPLASKTESELPRKIHSDQLHDQLHKRVYDRTFFVLGTFAAIWLAWALVKASFTLNWWHVALLVVFWLVLSYLALPRLNRILTAIYVPDYFIGRSRTSDGLLGDPLNVAFRGTSEQLSSTMTEAGWTLADPVTLQSSLHIIRATLLHKSYPEAPVSPLLLFGRTQDASYQQQVEGNPGQRHHVRFWHTPKDWPLPGGHRVDWLAGGTYDRKVGLSLFTLQVTHKVDANIDKERDHILDTIKKTGLETDVEMLSDFTTSYHSRNGGGDNVETDGNLPIVDLTKVKPGEGARDLQQASNTKMPLQIWFAAFTALLAGPAVGIWVLDHFPHEVSRGRHHVGLLDVVLAVVALAALAALFLLSVSLLRCNDLARRVLLCVAGVLVLAQVTTYERAVGDPAEYRSMLAGAVGVLLLIALSSPAATAWATGVSQNPD